MSVSSKIITSNGVNNPNLSQNLDKAPRPGDAAGDPEDSGGLWASQIG
jgi:hypothetical protein